MKLREFQRFAATACGLDGIPETLKKYFFVSQPTFVVVDAKERDSRVIISRGQD
jgi:hypothetical protein